MRPALEFIFYIGQALLTMTGLRMNVCRLLALWLLVILSGVALGEDVPDLYAGETPVVGQGAEERTAAIRDAFAKVLVKVSGDRSLPGKSAMAKELSKATSYVQQYRYRALDTGQVVQSEQQLVPDRLLWVQFDEVAVNRLLRNKGVPVWGGARPATLVWLGVEVGGQRSLFQAEMEPDLRQGMDEIARARGLPILFPLMDLEDRASLQVSDVWGAFEQAIRRASDRYLPDVILVGRLRKLGGDDWLADWTLYQPDTVKNWQSRGKSRQGVAAEGLQQMVDNLAARFAPQTVAQGDSNLRIRVSGLHHLADYMLVKDYLTSLDTIQSLDLLAASPNEVSFLVRVQGGRETLERGIMLSRVLEAVGAPDGTLPDTVSAEEFDAETLNYRLR